MKKILVPIDFSETSEAALCQAMDCACAGIKELILLHVIDPIEVANLGLIGIENYEERMREALVKDAERRLGEQAKKYAKEGLNIQTQVVVDKPWRGIIRYAIKERVDAIFMGSHGRGRVLGMLMGSTTDRVVRKAPTTVTVVKPETVRSHLRHCWHLAGGD